MSQLQTKLPVPALQWLLESAAVRQGSPVPGHWHLLLEQVVLPFAQTVPQAPQLFGSVARLAHLLPQHAPPVAQSQLPPQVAPVATLPGDVPSGQSHCPPTHVRDTPLWVPEHATPQPPQLELSVPPTSMHAPLVVEPLTPQNVFGEGQMHAPL